MSDLGVEEIVKHIQSKYDGILGILIVRNDGIPIRSTLPESLVVMYSALLTGAHALRPCVRTPGGGAPATPRIPATLRIPASLGCWAANRPRVSVARGWLA